MLVFALQIINAAISKQVLHENWPGMKIGIMEFLGYCVLHVGPSSSSCYLILASSMYQGLVS